MVLWFVGFISKLYQDTYKDNRQAQAVVATLTGAAKGEDLQVLYDNGWLGPLPQGYVIRSIRDEFVRRFFLRFRN